MKNYTQTLRSLSFTASLLFFGQMAFAAVPVVTGFEDNFDGTTTALYWVPEHATDPVPVFVLTQAGGELKVAIDKTTPIAAGNPAYGFSSLSLDLSATEVLNLAKNPIIKIRVKADKAFKLNVGPAIKDSANNKIAVDYPDSVKGDGVYRIYTFNFTGKFGMKYDSTKINKIFLNFNSGWGANPAPNDGKYKGNVTFDYIRIGDNARPATVNGYTDNFDGNTVSPELQPEHKYDIPPVFTLSQTGGELKVAIDKNKGIAAGNNVYGFAALTLDLSSTAILNMKNNPIIKIRLKANKSFKLNVGPAMVDSANNKIGLDYPDSVKGDSVYRVYTFRYKFVNKYDSTKIDKIYINFNSGWGGNPAPTNGKYAGNVTFDYIKIGDDANPGVVTTYVDNFNGNTISPAWQPEHKYDTPPVFTLSQSGGELKVAIDKNTGIAAGNNVYGFSSLSLDLSSTTLINMKNNPYIKIRVKADKAFLFNVGPSQVDSANQNVIAYDYVDSVKGDNTYREYTFKYKFANKYDSTKIDKIYLNFNSGWGGSPAPKNGKYVGNVTFDYIKIGDAAFPRPVVTTYDDEFDGTVVSPLWSPEHATDIPKVFTLSQSNGELKVAIDKNTGIAAGNNVYGFAALDLDLSKTEIINMTASPYIKFRIKADKAFKFNVGPSIADSASNKIAIDYPDSVKGDNTYREYTFNFTGKFKTYDPSQIDKFYLNFNSGWGGSPAPNNGRYAGNVTFDYIKIGDAAVPTGVISPVNSSLLSVYPNPTTGSIAIKNVSAESVRSITISNIKGQTVKIVNSYSGGFINVNELIRGMYFVRVVNTDNTVNNLKFIKQ